MPRPLADVVAALERIAPPALAGDWDNVGLLVDVTRTRAVRRCLLTIDLTEDVLDEAIEGKHELIVAYHPPIFAPLPRLRSSVPKERIVLRAVRAGIAIHSPHTALDAAPGGVNDWLADGLGPCEKTSIEPAPRVDGAYRLDARLPRADADRLAADLAALGQEPSVEILGESGRVTLTFDGDAPLRAVGDLPHELRAHCEILRRETALSPRMGQGRDVWLRRPARLATIVRRIKDHLRLSHVRVATARRHAEGTRVERVLVCAGAGGSVLEGRPADLYWTGEMRHHDVLAALGRGTSVVLCDHSNTERGYLPVLRERLDAELGGEVAIHVSARDAEPLRVV